MIEIADGKLKLPELKTFPLAKLGEAEQLMENRDFFGKIVMIP
jgi:NADPH:quinone reductase-like Zn-dependent oxidoreductase